MKKAVIYMTHSPIYNIVGMIQVTLHSLQTISGLSDLDGVPGAKHTPRLLFSHYNKSEQSCQSPVNIITMISHLYAP